MECKRKTLQAPGTQGARLLAAPAVSGAGASAAQILPQTRAQTCQASMFAWKSLFCALKSA